MDDSYENFKDFLKSMLILFKCSSGDNWRNVMTDCMFHNPNCIHDKTQCGNSLAIPFFISFMLISRYIILDLFVLALVD